ncbi:hypothetical protein [Aureliella helgolandensis]|uniref:Uncharacterized protein n=1 Tax=Aureliella helgolandensis TaxID=2527968 RepID=A0A518GB31_9BACT|nr:hypothetical protein [Aureliella helgolandensis]QDV25794.1 hypothetical protein Q31a_41210 [Aureliella helgolandensis]
MSQKDPYVAKRAIGYTLAGALAGAFAGAFFGENVRYWVERLVEIPWLPTDRLAYAIIGSQLFGILGLIRAIKQGRALEIRHELAENLDLQFKARLPGSIMDDLARLFDSYEVSDFRNAYIGSHHGFNFMVIEGVRERDDLPQLAAIVGVAWCGALHFPRCIVLPKQSQSWLDWVKNGLIKNAFGTKEIECNVVPQFASRYRVLGQRSEAIQTLLSASLQRLLLTSDDWQFRAGDACLVLWQPNRKSLDEISVRQWRQHLHAVIEAVNESIQPFRMVDDRVAELHTRGTLECTAGTEATSASGPLIAPEIITGEPFELSAANNTNFELRRNPSATDGDVLLRYFRSKPPRRCSLRHRFLLGLSGAFPAMIGLFFCLGSVPLLYLGVREIAARGQFLPFLFASILLMVGTTSWELSMAFSRMTKRLFKRGLYAEAEVLSIEKSSNLFTNHPNIIRLRYAYGIEKIVGEVHLAEHELKKLLVAIETTPSVPLLFDPRKPQRCLIRQQVLHAFGLRH